MNQPLLNLDELDAAGVLRHIVDHFASGGTQLSAESPLALAAHRALAASPAPVGPAPAAVVSSFAPGLVRHTLPIRPGLTEEQKARRRNTLGSSEIASVCGINPYQSVHAVWLAKCEGVEFEGNEATLLGQLLEPTIIAIYADRYGAELVRGDYMVGPEPWISCTPDAGIVGANAGVEAKLGGFRTFWMWGAGNTDEAESDAVPLHYLCQAQWQLLVTGWDYIDLSALLGSEFRTYRIRPSAEVQERLVERGRHFWERHVLTGEPPPVDGSEDARTMLRHLYPRSGGEVVQASAELEALARDLLAARQEFARAEEMKRFCENKMKAELRDARGAVGEDWRLRYATTKAGTRPFVFDHKEEKEGKAA